MLSMRLVALTILKMPEVLAEKEETTTKKKKSKQTLRAGSVSLHYRRRQQAELGSCKKGQLLCSVFCLQSKCYSCSMESAQTVMLTLV